MKTIYKYELKLEKEQELWLPLGAKIISVQEQIRSIVLWAFVDTEKPTAKRMFHIYGTGFKIPDGYTRKHLGTVQNGGFVWHVFEVDYSSAMPNSEQEDQRSVARKAK